MQRRLGDSESNMLATQSNLANAYAGLGRTNDALRLRRVVYSGCLKLDGEENPTTLTVTNNYAAMLVDCKRFEETKALMRKTIPVARRVLGESHQLALRMRWIYARALYQDTGATIDDLHEAVAILEETDRTARRVLGKTHPTALDVKGALRKSRAALGAREAPARLAALAL